MGGVGLTVPGGARLFRPLTGDLPPRIAWDGIKADRELAYSNRA
jgi:hypothetical protein